MTDVRIEDDGTVLIRVSRSAAGRLALVLADHTDPNPVSDVELRYVRDMLDRLLARVRRRGLENGYDQFSHDRTRKPSTRRVEINWAGRSGG